MQKKSSISKVSRPKIVILLGALLLGILSFEKMIIFVVFITFFCCGGGGGGGGGGWWLCAIFLSKMFLATCATAYNI